MSFQKYKDALEMRLINMDLIRPYTDRKLWSLDQCNDYIYKFRKQNPYFVIEKASIPFYSNDKEIAAFPSRSDAQVYCNKMSRQHPKYSYVIQVY